MKKFVGIFFLGFILIISACGSSETSGDKNASLKGKTVELIVPHAAGGGTDAVARSVARLAEKNLDASIGVVNKPGGGGAVGMAEGASAKPDGLKLTFATVELTMLNHLGLADFTHEDFEPVAQVNFDPSAITVDADAPYDTVEEFVQYAKDHPGEIRIGGSGFGAIWHLAAEAFADANGIEIEFIPFDGAAPSISSLLGGHIEAVTVSPGEVKTQVDAGELKTLAIMADERSDALPEVPTLSESDVESVTVGAWRGVVAPKGTPASIIKEAEEAFLKAAEDEEFIEFMRSNGLGISIKNSEEFKQEMVNSSELFQPLIEKLDIAG